MRGRGSCVRGRQGGAGGCPSAVFAPHDHGSQEIFIRQLPHASLEPAPPSLRILHVLLRLRTRNAIRHLLCFSNMLFACKGSLVHAKKAKSWSPRHPLQRAARPSSSLRWQKAPVRVESSILLVCAEPFASAQDPALRLLFGRVVPT